VLLEVSQLVVIRRSLAVDAVGLEELGDALQSAWKRTSNLITVLYAYDVCSFRRNNKIISIKARI
jgi:hypothetical protein